MPRRKDLQRTEIIKKAVRDLFVYDDRRGDVYYSPDMSYLHPTKAMKAVDVPVGKLRTYNTPRRIYSYRIVSVPLQHYDTDSYLKKNAGNMIMVRHIVWFLNTGVWPDGNVIHKDENPNNCRFDNLVHIRPEYMHVYQRMVNDLDPRRITEYLERRAQKRATSDQAMVVVVPVFNVSKQKYQGTSRSFHSAKDAYDALNQARYERLIWVRDNRLGGVDTTFYDNGLDLPKTKPLVPSDDAPYKVEQVIADEDGNHTPFVASLLIGAVKFIANRRRH